MLNLPFAKTNKTMLKSSHFFYAYIIILFLVILSNAYGQVGSNDEISNKTGRSWHDGKRWRTVWMANDEIAVFHEYQENQYVEGGIDRRSFAMALAEKAISGAIVEKTTGSVTYYKMPEVGTSESIATLINDLKIRPGVQHSSPVFYPGTTKSENRMALTGEIIVGFKETQTEQSLESFATRYGIFLLKRFRSSPNSALFDGRNTDEQDTIALSNRIFFSGEVTHAYPNWLREIPLLPPDNNSRSESNNQEQHVPLDLGTESIVQEEEQSTDRQFIHNSKLDITAPKVNVLSIEEEVQTSTMKSEQKAKNLMNIHPQVLEENQISSQSESITNREVNELSDSIESIPAIAEESQADQEVKED
jgi:hypothetical protein